MGHRLCRDGAALPPAGCLLAGAAVWSHWQNAASASVSAVRLGPSISIPSPDDLAGGSSPVGITLDAGTIPQPGACVYHPITITNETPSANTTDPVDVSLKMVTSADHFQSSDMASHLSWTLYQGNDPDTWTVAKAGDFSNAAGLFFTGSAPVATLTDPSGATSSQDLILSICADGSTPESLAGATSTGTFSLMFGGAFGS